MYVSVIWNTKGLLSVVSMNLVKNTCIGKNWTIGGKTQWLNHWPWSVLTTWPCECDTQGLHKKMNILKVALWQPAHTHTHPYICTYIILNIIIHFNIQWKWPQDIMEEHKVLWEYFRQHLPPMAQRHNVAHRGGMCWNFVAIISFLWSGCQHQLRVVFNPSQKQTTETE